MPNDANASDRRDHNGGEPRENWGQRAPISRALTTLLPCALQASASFRHLRRWVFAPFKASAPFKSQRFGSVGALTLGGVTVGAVTFGTAPVGALTDVGNAPPDSALGGDGRNTKYSTSAIASTSTMLSAMMSPSGTDRLGLAAGAADPCAGAGAAGGAGVVDCRISIV